MPLGLTRLNERTQRPNQNINFIKTGEKDGPDQAIAQDILERVAAQMSPIMKEHYLLVNSLEDFPPNREFWGRNFNAGECIQLVLKSPFSGRWLPYSFICRVMLHELAHNKQMNHSKAFHAVRIGFTEEHDALTAKGYTGEGFWSRGQPLSADYTANRELLEDEKPTNLCGGAYRKKHRRANTAAEAGEKRKVTYAERQQRKKERLFGKDEGAALGADMRTRRDLEKDSAKSKGKQASAKASAVRPRVAQSQRGRDLRAEAAVRRAEEQKKAERLAKKEEEDGDGERDFFGRPRHEGSSSSSSGSKAKRKKREDSDDDEANSNADDQLTTTDEEDEKKAVDVGMGETLVKVEEGQEEDWEAELERMDIGCSTSRNGTTSSSTGLGSRDASSGPASNGHQRSKATVRAVQQDDSATEDSDIEFLEEVRPSTKAPERSSAVGPQQKKTNESAVKNGKAGYPSNATGSPVPSSSKNIKPRSRSSSFTLPPPLRSQASASAGSPRRHATLPRRAAEVVSGEYAHVGIQRMLARAEAQPQSGRAAPSADTPSAIMASMLSEIEAESAHEETVCRACTVPNDGQKALCFVCGNVLRPERTPNWRCSEGDCAHNINYSNPMDAGVCGCCGTRRAG